MPSFRRLNQGWNAEPNAPDIVTQVSGVDLVIRFALNAFRFPLFAEGEMGMLRFPRCARYRLGPTNDEGWYRGQCRYGKLAPAWGEFYEITEDDPFLDLPNDWCPIGDTPDQPRHFLFYLKDETFECIAGDWQIEPASTNALIRIPTFHG